MKKIIVIAFLVSLVAAPAFAAVTNAEFNAGTISGSSTAGPTEDISVLSNNVGAAIASNDIQYAATTAHLNGSKQYGSSSQSTKIFSRAFKEGTTPLIVPQTSDTAEFDSDWTSL
jgi:hypothetical protein